MALRAQLQQLEAQQAQAAQAASTALVVHEPEPAPDLTIVDIINALRSLDPAEREEALALLGEIVDTAYGEDGAAVGQAVRDLGGVQVLGWMLLDPNVIVQQEALLVLGNLCSDACDPNSRITKRVLFECGAHRALLQCINSEDPGLLVYTCGTIQNLCHDDSWARVFVKEGLVPRLTHLAKFGADGERHALRAVTCRYALPRQVVSRR